MYSPLTGMTKIVQQKLIDDHFLFKEGDRFLQTANACRYWPTGRGIFHNTAKTFLVWCGEEDHLRIISMQMGGDAVLFPFGGFPQHCIVFLFTFQEMLARCSVD